MHTLQLSPSQVTLTPWEMPNTLELMQSGLELMHVPVEERGTSARVVGHLESFLKKRRLERKLKERVPSKKHLHSLAVELAVVLGHQLKKSGWSWVQFEWRGPCPLRKLTPAGVKTFYWCMAPDDSDELAERFGMRDPTGTALVMPIYDLLDLLLHARCPIELNQRLGAVLGRTTATAPLELHRLAGIEVS